MSRLLKAGGFDPSDVVDVNVYIADVAKFDAMNEGYRQIFSQGFSCAHHGAGRHDGSGKHARRNRHDGGTVTVRVRPMTLVPFGLS